MKRSPIVLSILLAAASGALAAQQAATLTPQQAHGRQILTQNCNICHLPQSAGSLTYGPLLNKESVNGDNALMKTVIQNGLVKMPGWKYTLSDSDINDVIAYVRTLPVVAPPKNPTKGQGEGP